MTTEMERILSPYLFPVKETQVLVHNGDKFGLKPTDKYKAIIREDTDELISIQRNTYKLVPNREIILPLLEQLDKIDSKWHVDNSHSFCQNDKFRLMVRFDDLTINDGESDIALSLYLSSSYNSSEAIRLIFGILRFVCSNGQILGQVMSKFYGKHTTNLEISNLKEVLEKAYDYLPIIKHRIQLLQASKVDKAMKRNVENVFGKTIASYVEEQPDPIDQYRLLNYLTFFISHKIDQRLRASYQMQVSNFFHM